MSYMFTAIFFETSWILLPFSYYRHLLDLIPRIQLHLLASNLLLKIFFSIFLTFVHIKFANISAWIRALCDLVEKYYKNETRVPIRLKALSVLMDTYKSNRHIYEEDLLERVVLPFLGSADTEPSDLVRLEAVKVSSSL